MSGTTTFSVEGAEVTVDTTALFRAWFEKHLAKPAAPAGVQLPSPRDGEKYLGSIITPDGRIRHTFLLPCSVKKNWDLAIEWANSIGGDLPDRVEQAMLLAFMPDEFKEEAYWSNTQHAGYSYYAWGQGFDYGYQSYYSKSAELFARAVRREFSPSVI